MKQSFIFVVAVLMIGSLAGCENEADETAMQGDLSIEETLQGEMKGVTPQVADIDTIGFSQKIDDYIKNFVALYSSNAFDDTAPAILIEELNIPSDNDQSASLKIYSDLSGKRLRYELRSYGETGNQDINYYLCENFVWISRQSNYYSSWILTDGDPDVLYSEIDNWLIVGETLYIMHDNGELEEMETTKLEVPLPDDFEALYESLEKFYKCEKAEEGYELTIYSSSGATVLSEVYPQEPGISWVTENVIEIAISVGSPACYRFYVDIEEDKISDAYFNSILVDEYVAYMEDDRKLILCDIFYADQQEDLLYMTIVRDFTKTADPMSAIMGIELIDSENIELTYWTGEDYTEVKEIIPIDKDTKQSSR